MFDLGEEHHQDGISCEAHLGATSGTKTNFKGSPKGSTALNCDGASSDLGGGGSEETGGSIGSGRGRQRPLTPATVTRALEHSEPCPNVLRRTFSTLATDASIRSLSAICLREKVWLIFISEWKSDKEAEIWKPLAAPAQTLKPSNL